MASDPSAPLLFNRVCRVVVDTVSVDGLRASFKVKKTNGKEPNTGEISIYNLSPSTRGSLKVKGAKVSLEAGYQDTSAVVFSGDIRTLEHMHQAPDWVTKVTTGDAERTLQHAFLSESFRAGTRVADVIRVVVRTMGLDPGNLESALATIPDQFVQGYTAHGKCSRELDTLLRSRGFTWSVHGGRLQVLKPGQVLAATRPVFTYDSGLVGAPQLKSPEKEKGPAILQVKVLLQPTLYPGQAFELRDTPHAGIYRVENIEHTGDTAGGDWYSAISAIKPGAGP